VTLSCSRFLTSFSPQFSFSYHLGVFPTYSPKRSRFLSMSWSLPFRLRSFPLLKGLIVRVRGFRDSSRRLGESSLTRAVPGLFLVRFRLEGCHFP